MAAAIAATSLLPQHHRGTAAYRSPLASPSTPASTSGRGLAVGRPPARPATSPPPRMHGRRRRSLPPPRVWPFDLAWGTNLNLDSQQLAGDLFAASIFPYAAFLFFAHKSRKFPGLTLFGFYFLLVFVGGSIPAGIYAKTHYHDILANVDWLHGGAESLLTLTNLFIVLGLRSEIRRVEAENKKNKGAE